MEFTGERFLPNSSLDSELEIEHLQRYYSVKELVKDKIVVDAACGEGYGSNFLAKYADKVYGIDIDEEVIGHAKNSYYGMNLEYLPGSVDNMPISNKSVDVVISFETIEHVDKKTQEEFLSEVKRVLRKDGFLIISTPDRHVYSDLPNYENDYHKREFYKEEFYNFLSNYFKYIDLYSQGFQVTSVIGNNKSKSFNHIDLPNYYQATLGKYLIAICSDSPINEIAVAGIESIVLDVDNKYQKLVNRILELQVHVEQKNSHIGILQNNIQQQEETIKVQNFEIGESLSRIQILSLQITEQDQKITQQNQKTTQQNQEIAKLNQEIVKQSQKIVEQDRKIASQELIIKDSSNIVKDLEDWLQEKNIIITSQRQKILDVKQWGKELVDKIREDNEVSEAEEMFANWAQSKEPYPDAIDNLQGQIETLLQQERILNIILHSRGWRFLQQLYRLEDFIIPPSSRRRFLIKALYRVARNPRQMMRGISLNKVKQFVRCLRSRDNEELNRKWEQFLDIYGQERNRIEIFRPKTIKHKLVFNKIKRPLVSIIIPVHNQWQYTHSCLHSILENTMKDTTYEIIIADDVSTDETVNISNHVENVTVIRNETNLGFLRNCNNTAKAAKGRYILFLNNDTNVQKGWLKHLVDLAESDKEIGLVGSKLVYPNGKLQEAGGIIWEDASGWNYGRLDNPDRPQYNYVKEVDYISGACIMIRAKLWEEIGGFDERFVPAYFEDADLAFEARNRGYKVMLQPKSVVVHFEGISHGTDEGKGTKGYQVQNRNKFIDKWKDVLEAEQLPNGQDVFWARDRSRNKKTILVIDHYVPHYDKDAGSRTMYQYLKLFVSMGLNVKFLGDNFFKHEPYTSELEQLGIEVLYGQEMQKSFKKWLTSNGAYIDYTYLLRPHIAVKYIDVIKQLTKSKVFYNGTDFHYLRETRQYKIDKNIETLKRARQMKNQEFNLFAKSDVIYTISDFEKSILSKKLPNKRVVVIPTYLYEQRFPLGSFSDYQSRLDITFVGGFVHPPNIDGVLWFIEKIFPLVNKELPRAELNVIGSNPPSKISKLKSAKINITGYLSDEKLQEYYSKTRVVIAPLRFGAGVKGKIIEAIAFGLPVVTTTIGAEGITNADDIIISADLEEEFAKKIVEIYSNPEKWSGIRDKMTQYANSYLSIDYAKRVVSQDIHGGDKT